MEEYINKSALLAEIERKYETNIIGAHSAFRNGKIEALREVKDLINTLEVKDVNEVPATVMVNKYGNRFISSWPGLKEYDDLKEGQEIKIVIPLN